MVKLNKQATLAIFAVVFATAMIVGSIAASSDNMAFAHHGKKTKQVQAQKNANDQSTNCAANGGFATGTGVGLLAGTGAGVGGLGGINACFNTNANTNAATGSQAATS